ncbi:enoyl-CoA hydratase/isomerase family protein [Thermomonospora curvata]|uniref:Enoyl-CoA hydratase/isomerase n=1 Tax=Thermomonospora curvata (strain ATCC 19995 / DSM 43183 / JCM 3096 / KCTC 9072 / NBRC 15933 / NCIMB 10081 / Henssen B9) TaxID=471852 RepID=D1A749_THECD|nr:enoyl-CoA hydratase/isomerase family protein [Thermomonospora curvata]ACZ00255.1 Enoyl-CoA hydratase/isomerase [Thermomonospora curvata DSM 43183]
MSEQAPLRCEVTDGVGTITIDRPGKRNAMSAAMWRKLPVLLERLETDPAVRVVVLTGAGGHFCAGADIGELADITSGDLATEAETALARFPKPTLAVIRGFAVGGGCQLAAACDLRLAADDARFGITPAKLGILYPAEATARLVRLIGPAAAKYLLFSGELVDAAHALRIGLVDEVLPADRLAARVAEFTRILTSRSQFTQQGAKDIVEHAAAGTLTRELVEAWAAEARRSPDSAEGVAAFLERRPPVFTWTGPAAHRR